MALQGDARIHGNPLDSIMPLKRKAAIAGITELKPTLSSPEEVQVDTPVQARYDDVTPEVTLLRFEPLLGPGVN